MAMKVLDKMWVLAIGVGLGALLVLTIDAHAGKLSIFLIWASLISMFGVLTFCSVQIKRGQAKKSLPVRSVAKSRSAKGKLKVVEGK